MIFLLKLVLAHCIGDFLLQPGSWVTDKESRKIKSPKLYLHIAIHGLLVLLLLWNLSYWPLALALMGIHYLIDITKLYAQQEPTKVTWFFIDQALHFLSIALIWVFWFEPFPPQFLLQFSNTFWLYISAIFLLTYVTSIIVQVTMWKWTVNLNESNAISLPNAGRYIGYLERLFILIFIFTGHWESIGFLITAKSVFRFGDLKEARDRKLTEYFLIGTLLSFGIAIIISLSLKWLLTLA